MVYNYDKEKLKKKSSKIFILVVTILIILIAGSIAFQLLLDYMQVKEIGEKYTSVFWINFYVKLASMLIGFAIAFAIFYVSTIFIRKNVLNLNSQIEFLKKKYPAILICILIAFLSSNVIREIISSRYLLYANSVKFNITDPIFNQDIGYYIFERPFLMSMIQSISGLWLFQIFFTIFAYMILYSVATQGVVMISSIIKEKTIVLHNVINIVIFFAIKALTYKFVSEDILYSNFGEVVGAGFTDIAVWLKYYRVAPFLIVAIVIVTIVFLRKGQVKKSVYTILSFPAVWIVVALIAAVVQSFIVSPNEVIKERPFIEHNIKFTRSAYNLNNIVEREFPVENNINAEFVKNNMELFENIRITDYPSTLTVLNQLQGIRNYYRFTDVDIAKYNIEGKDTAVFAGVREMYKGNLPDEAKTYINMKMRYTHGFGIAMNPVNKITNEGHPKFIIKDIPTVSIEGAPEVKQPRIYFGELTNDYVIVNTDYKELDYAQGQDDVEFDYDGKAGIKMSFLNRLIFAVKNGDYRILISGYIKPDSRLLLNRNILERVNRVAPFFSYDNNPYIVINDEGKLKWIVDIYTISKYYPYSQKMESGINYIRNSGKAIVDAYDGTVDFYITDKNDPIIMAYKSIYPTLFNEESLPEDIQKRIKYPEQIFNIQAQIFRQYHMTNPMAFYNKADYWNISNEKYRGQTKNVDPYYNLMRLPETEEEELVLMLPYTLKNKDNMVAWLAARSDFEDYGHMVLYQFPKGINVYGPMQIENRIDSNPDISREMTLWGQGGSSVIRGNLLVIPINNSILYVEPVYITASGETSIPEMKRVIVGYRDRIVMEPTLDQSLIKIFGEEISDVTDDVEEVNKKDLIQRALDTFNELKRASGENDFEMFGKKLRELDEIMNLIEENK